VRDYLLWEEKMNRLAIRLLGAFEVTLNEQPLTCFESDKVRALLIYLATERQQPHRRDHLAGLLWPEHPDQNARTILRHTLANLRKTIGDRGANPPFLDISRQTIQFNTHKGIWVDVHTLSQILDGGDTDLGSLKRAVDLYRGNFLEGFHLEGCLAFQEWGALKREELARKMTTALDRLIQGHESRREFERAIPFARRLVDLEPWDEKSHRRLMRLLAFSDQRTAALNQFENCKRSLAAELDIGPSLKTINLYERIRDRALNPPTSLSAQANPFIGREKEQRELEILLDRPSVRLVTILAPGGMGKTHLALEVGATQLDNFEHGIHFVSLQSAEGPDDIIPTIAETLQFKLSSGQELKDQLIDYYRGRNTLLILDNFEHLLESAGLIVDLLAAAIRLKVLVTSRSKLNLSVETVYVLSGLAYPDSTDHAMDDTGYGAIQLFAQSARRARHDFDLRPDNLGDVTQICRLVSGIPLGILLAAGWVDTLAVKTIAAEIEQSIDFLETELQDIPGRHRSMRAAFMSSWRLLSEQEREIFARLSVFSGGCTRQAAQTVAGASSRDLTALVNKSLLQRKATDRRYELHELLCQLGAEHLAAIGEIEKYRAAHSDYYLSMLADSEDDLKGNAQLEALEVIDADFENIRAGWRYAVNQANAESIKRAIEGLYLFCNRRGRNQDGLRSLVIALERFTPEEGYSVVWAMLATRYDLLGSFGLEKFDPDELLVISRQEGSGIEIGHALVLVTRQHIYRHKFALAREVHLERLAIYEGLGDKFYQAWCLFSIAFNTYNLGRKDDSFAEAKQALDIQREIGDRIGQAKTLHTLWGNGRDPKMARIYLQESTDLYAEMGNWGRWAGNFSNLASHIFDDGEVDRARQMARQALRKATELNDPRSLCGCLSTVANLEIFAGNFKQGQELVKRAFQLTKNPSFVSGFYLSLATAAFGLEDYVKARKDLAETIEQCLHMQRWYRLVEALEVCALLMESEGQSEMALELLFLREVHPADPIGFWYENFPLLVDLREKLRTELSPEQYAAAQASGRVRDLEATMRELLDLLKQEHDG